MDEQKLWSKIILWSILKLITSKYWKIDDSWGWWRFKMAVYEVNIYVI